MPTSTLVDLALTAFITTITESVPDGVEVVDGTPLVGQDSTQFVIVTGWETTERKPATFGLGIAAGAFSIEEQFELIGYVRCQEGSSVQSNSRASAVAIFEAMESAVRADPTLGTGGGINTVRVAWFNFHAGTQGPLNGGRGNGTQMDFRCHIEGRIQ